MSDHNCIHLMLSAGNGQAHLRKGRPPPAWRFPRDSKMVTIEEVTGHFLDEEVLVTPGNLASALRKACDESLPRKGSTTRRASDYWWNEEVDT